MLPVAILAGGLATRMYPITKTIPKALIEVSGRPFIFHQLEYLRAQGVQRVVLCIGDLGDEIQSMVGNGSAIGLDVSYSFDGPVLQGTGGALRKALPLLGDKFFVLYGDSFLPVDFTLVKRAYYESNKIALMTVLKNKNCWDKSNVLFREGKLLEYNKRMPSPDMDYIDYGLGVVASQALSNFSSTGPFDLADVYQQLSFDGQLAGYEIYSRFYEIGSYTGLKETEVYFSEISKNS